MGIEPSVPVRVASDQPLIFFDFFFDRLTLSLFFWLATTLSVAEPTVRCTNRTLH